MRIRYKLLEILSHLFFDEPQEVIRRKVGQEIQTFDKRKHSFAELPSLVRELTAKSKDPILEIGCGNGGFLYGLNKISNNNLYGIEIDNLRAKTALEHVSESSTMILLANGEQLPFKPNSFQIIFIIEVIEHLISYKEFLKEIHRVLKPNGYAFITFPSFRSLRGSHLFHMVPIPWAQLVFGYAAQRECALKKLQKVKPDIDKLDHINGINIFSFMKSLSGMFSLEWFRIYASRTVLKPLQFVPFIDDLAADSVRALLKKTRKSYRNIYLQYLVNKKSQLIETVKSRI